MGVLEKARELVEALKEEEVYQEFCRCQELVFSQQRQKDVLMALRRREFALRRLQLLGKEVAQQERSDLYGLYEEARRDQALRDYLDAEYCFSKMMLEVQGIINAAVPVRKGNN